jgi:hypothetical protein
LAIEGIEVGRLLGSGITGFSFGCQVSQNTAVEFGALVKVPLDDKNYVYGIIYDIHVDEDGLVRQLVTSDEVSDQVIQDNRLNRNVPMEISVLSLGYGAGDQIRHLLPPRAPLSLDSIYLCTDEEIKNFTEAGRFGYFRHILRNQDFPVSEVLAAHIQQAHIVHIKAGSHDFANRAAKELITLLRDDYDVLMEVLSALADSVPSTQ